MKKVDLRKGVFFYLAPFETIENLRANYQQDAIVLAEGLEEIGVPIYSNIDYWEKKPFSGDYLFKKIDGVDVNSCDVIFMSRFGYAITSGKKLPDFMVNNLHQVTVLSDDYDGKFTPAYLNESRGVDIILKHSMVKGFDNPPNLYPWAFGISQRQRENIESSAEKDQNIHSNSRRAHALRSFAQKNIIPKLTKVWELNNTYEAIEKIKEDDPITRYYWEHSCRRHSNNYFHRISRASAIDCFGGGYASVFFKDTIPHRLARKINAYLPLTKNRFIYQFDSYRLWEAFFSKAVVLHVDFEKYGCILPEQPVNRKHYIGFDLDNIDDTVSFLQHNKSQLEDIAMTGQEWALKNYSQKAMAERFIKYVSTKAAVK